jgi:hypothetical protein
MGDDLPPRRWAFTRRTVEDRIIFVRAKTLQEAWRKARADEGEGTSDAEVVRSTYRRSPENDPS